MFSRFRSSLACPDFVLAARLFQITIDTLSNNKERTTNNDTMGIDWSKYPLPKRFRHHTAANLYMPASELKEKSDYYPPVYESINWRDFFLNGRKPDLLDVGCGKGAFLFDIAQGNPDKNILGIEVRLIAVNWLKDIITGEKVENCGIMWYSVVNGLNFIEDKSIEKIFYLFPDPWPKRKHIKRRAFNPDVLNEFHRVMKDDAVMYLATDVTEVDEYQKKVLYDSGKFIYSYTENDNEWQLPRTNKQKFCIRENIPYTRMLVRKK